MGHSLQIAARRKLLDVRFASKASVGYQNVICPYGPFPDFMRRKILTVLFDHLVGCDEQASRYS